LELQSKILQITEHEEPLNCLVFADNFNCMITSTKSELVLWTLEIEENLDYVSDEAENSDMIKKRESENTRFIVKVK
jgi:hypothetical protein